ncbi:MAG: arginine decarboxylase [Thermoleophilaceae bacterium]|jgi:lysine decarboxylase|nr:arginine decarboxylase [Thermoleophilaceae bacterium]MEA2454638.1 arginine decarboxylase [Thermoleophilaceae bacterium]
MPASQPDTPYLDALRAFAERHPARLHVPGHKGGAGADPRMLDALGERALALDIPALMWGIDVGVDPTPFAESQRLAAEAWGARRTWFLVNGASQGNHVAMLTLAHAGDRVVLQRNAHSSTVDALVLSGLRPTFAAPELDPDLHIAHCLRPETLDRALTDTPGAVGAAVVSPTYFGAVADVGALAEVAHGHGVPLIVDEAWGAHLAFSDELPAHALSLGADLVISSTHKIVGSLTQSAMVHLGHGGRLDEEVVDRCVTLVETTSPNALLAASLDSARRSAAVDGRALLGENLRGLAHTRAAVREVPGLDVLDERLVGASGVFAYDPLRLTIDVRGTLTSGYELARLLREQDVHVELAGENVMVAVFGMGEDVSVAGERLVAALHRAVDSLSGRERDPEAEAFAPPPPWGELAMTPREAFLGRQDVVPVREAVGRVAAESLAAYPPGIPNVLPGERLTAETLDYIQQAIDHGGSLRGASDRALRTLRVVAEGL